MSFQRPSDPPGPDVVSRRLAREVAGWRPDLVAYRSERLAVITPPGSPGPVARALATGELVCDVLEGLFGADGASGARDPLILLLYQDEAEYRAQSERDHSAPEVARGWTAGHYDPAENVSRMFVPTDDRDSRRLLGVYAHELAHHWLATRSPFADRARSVRGGADRAGFWVVEGIAQWTGELALDPDAGTWSDDDPRAASLDGVVNTRPADRVPWGRLLTLDKRGFDGLSIANDRSVPLTWQLGVRLKQSELALFYDQAGALAHWLYGADHGTHRQALVDAVRGWYLGNAAPTDVASVVGLDPDRLGERVVAFASEAVR